MSEPKALNLTELFTGLTGRQVSVKQLFKPLETKAKQAFGSYLVKPHDKMRIVQLDLPLLGSLGGALLGLPSSAVQERLATNAMGEPLRDAVHEFLNVASAIVSIEERAVFQTMYLDSILLPTAIWEFLKSPACCSYFQITIDGYEGGAFSIFSVN